MTPGESFAEHERWMRAALALGRRCMGRAAPNPSVGALVVKDGIVLGRGVTAPGGRPHAEPLALAEAGDAARGATIYVTLEPCSHVGRTPPCTQAILDAGIARVVFALRDPDPRVAGRGIEQLRAAGLTVIGPVSELEARRDHRGHVLRVTVGRPTVTVKLAETADGFAAAPAGSPRLLITGPRTNAAVHRWRALHDAILVGSGTAIADDPLLTVRLPGVANHPLRVVLDTHLRLPGTAALVRTIPEVPLLLLTSADADARRAERLEELGAEINRVPAPGGTLDLGAASLALGRRGLTRVFCEGGPTLASALIAAGLADSVIVITAERRLGSRGVPALTPRARGMILDPALFVQAEDTRLGSDRLRQYERIDPACSPD